MRDANGTPEVEQTLTAEVTDTVAAKPVLLMAAMTGVPAIHSGQGRRSRSP